MVLGTACTVYTYATDIISMNFNNDCLIKYFLKKNVKIKKLINSAFLLLFFFMKRKIPKINNFSDKRKPPLETRCSEFSIQF